MAKKLTTSTFIEKAKQVHGDKYDYSFVNYVNAHKKVRIICKEHGEFLQTPGKHIQMRKCPKCALQERAIKRRTFLDDFIHKALKIHHRKYDYSLVKYVNTLTKVKIICPIHGEFEQIPAAHLQGHSCSKCRNIISKPEIELHNFLKINNVSFITNDRKLLGNKQELDIIIPDSNLAIEFNGYWWHYDKSNTNVKPQGYHGNKSNLCRKLGYRLLHIREDLWKKDKEKMKQIIKNLL